MPGAGMAEVPSLLQRMRERVAQAAAALDAKDFTGAAEQLRAAEELARFARYVVEASK